MVNLHWSSDILIRPQKFETISHLIWHLLSKRQIICEIVSNCVDFLENLNFNSYLNTVSPHTVSSLENVFFSDFGLHALICTQRISKGRSCENFCFISNLQRYSVLAKDSLSFFFLWTWVSNFYISWNPLLKVRQIRNDFFKPMFLLKNKRTNSLYYLSTLFLLRSFFGRK